MALPDEPSGTGHPDQRGDAELLTAYRGGDRGAAELLVERSYRLVYGALFRLTGGDADLSADLSQETYRRAWQALHRFRGRSSVSTWLYRIAYTTFLNHVRRPRRHEPMESEARPERPAPGPTPEQRAESSADRLRLRRAVLGLGEELRFTVTARYWGELSVAEIAREVGITTVAVRKRLEKAMRQLAQSLQEEAR